MITGCHDEIRYNSLSKIRDSQLVYIIHLATETSNCAWQMNKRSILRDLYDLFINLKHPRRFESQTPPQDDHIDRITDFSTRYGQAPAVALAWDWPREDGKCVPDGKTINMKQNVWFQGGICPEKCQLYKIQNGWIVPIFHFNMRNIWVIKAPPYQGEAFSFCTVSSTGACGHRLSSMSPWYLQNRFFNPFGVQHTRYK